MFSFFRRRRYRNRMMALVASGVRREIADIKYGLVSTETAFHDEAIVVMVQWIDEKSGLWRQTVIAKPMPKDDDDARRTGANMGNLFNMRMGPGLWKI